MQLPVCSINNSRSLALSLEGTVLVCRDLGRKMGAELQIPVELITISEGRRFNARRLILALFVLVASIVVAVIPSMLSNPSDAREGEPTSALLFGTIVALGGFLAFCGLLVRFFFKVGTVCLTIAPHGSSIEFWRQRRYAQALDALLEEIRRRQRTIEEEASAPAKGPTIYVDPPSLTRRFFAYLYFALLPCLITERPRLLLLAIFPVTWYVFRQVQYLRQPLAYRRAVRRYRKQKWAEAGGLLTDLLSDFPDYLPGYLLLVHVYTRSGRFDDALDVIAQYGDTWPDLSQDIYSATWYCKRIGRRREDPALPTDRRDSRPTEGETCE